MATGRSGGMLCIRVLYSGCLGTAYGVRGGLPSLSGLPVRSAAVPSRQAQSTASEASQVEHGGLGSRRPLWLGHIQPPSPRHLPSFAPPAVLQGVPLVARERREGSRLRIRRGIRSPGGLVGLGRRQGPPGATGDLSGSVRDHTGAGPR